MGIERYRGLWPREALTPAHFTPEIFLTPTEDDPDPATNRKLRDYHFDRRFPRARLVGDKYPRLTEHLDFIFRTFEQAKVVVIVRNPVSVLESNQARLDNPDDAYRLATNKALQRWNQALVDTHSALEAGQDVVVVSYERLFRGPAAVARLYGAVGLGMQGANRQRIDKILADARAVRRGRVSRDEDMRLRVFASARLPLYRKLLNAHCILRER